MPDFRNPFEARYRPDTMEFESSVGRFVRKVRSGVHDNRLVQGALVLQTLVGACVGLGIYMNRDIATDSPPSEPKPLVIDAEEDTNPLGEMPNPGELMGPLRDLLRTLEWSPIRTREEVEDRAAGGGGVSTIENSQEKLPVAPITKPVDRFEQHTPPPDSSGDGEQARQIDSVEYSPEEINEILEEIGGIYIDGQLATAESIEQVFGEYDSWMRPPSYKFYHNAIRGEYSLSVTVPDPDPLLFTYDSQAGTSEVIIEIAKDGGTHTLRFTNNSDSHRKLGEILFSGTGGGKSILQISEKETRGSLFPEEGGAGSVIFNGLPRE